MIVDSKALARKRARWQGPGNAARFAEQIGEANAAQRLKNKTEIDIVRRFMRAQRVLDVGIGTGRISLPLLQDGIQLTGIDASASMIQRCAGDKRAVSVRLVQGELEHLPFAGEAFDTVISVDTFAHFSDWKTNLDEFVRVTATGGRIIVDIGSRDHIESVAQVRGCSPNEVRADELSSADAYTLRLSCADLRDYAAERNITLVSVIPYGAVFGSLVPNYWISESYAFRSGGIDRLVSWTGADPLLFSFAEFIERRIIQQLEPSVTGRIFAVFERDPDGEAYRGPLPLEMALLLADERGTEKWKSEFDAHARHEPNRAFAVALLLAAWPVRLQGNLRAALPAMLLHELDRTERCAHIDDICADVVASWRSAATYVAFHGVNLSDVFGALLESELRDRLEASE